MTNEVVVLYLPVIHEGYLRFLEPHRESRILILGGEVIEKYTPLVRDLRKISPETGVNLLKSLGFTAEVATVGMLRNINQPDQKIITPNETEMHQLAEELLSNTHVFYESTFLRWDKTLTVTETIVAPDRIISQEAAHQELIRTAQETAAQSADWWRQVGAVLVREGQVIGSGHNHHLPTDYHLVQNGDPRVNVDAGQRPDLYTSIHGEASLIAEAAKQGISTKDASIFVTTFPCPNCARLIGESGITKVYYEKGFSRLDGEEILKKFGVEIVLVQPT